MELQSEKRHEFISGELIEMPGEKDINNQIAIFICTFLVQHLMPKGFQVYINDVKVAIPDRTKYFYPMYLQQKNCVPGKINTSNTNRS
jgi:Uma2 family endonuclease